MASRFRAPRRSSVIELLLFLLLVVLFIYIIYPSDFSSSDANKTTSRDHLREDSGDSLPCALLPGAEDTVVVFKTSAAESEQKLPIHFDTTLRCYPNHLIFSDFKETLQGHHILDALEHVSPGLRDTHPDFDLWRRLQHGGPDVLEDDEIWNADQTSEALDKWKWLPMINRTLHDFPHQKWYVFLEPDTFIFWTNLLRWLSTRDHTQPQYIGAFDRRAAMMSLVHGGAGIVFSHAAMQAMHALLRADAPGWEERTAHHPTGASVLAEVLVDAQVPLTDAWPIMQHQRLARVDYADAVRGRRLWCHPTVSYGGLSPPAIAEMWKFEQEWMREHPDRVLYHRDVFSTFVLPRLIVRSGRVDDWDNFSGTFQPGTLVESVGHCQDLCLERSDCVQFAFFNGSCECSAVPKMGEFRRDVHSRWLLARAQAFADHMDVCTGEESWMSE